MLFFGGQFHNALIKKILLLPPIAADAVGWVLALQRSTAKNDKLPLDGFWDAAELAQET